jgi:hypothetical protein
MTYDPTDSFPRIAAACTDVKWAMTLADAANKGKFDQADADRATELAEAKAIAAYARELLPIFANGPWRLSADHARDPDAVLGIPPISPPCTRSLTILSCSAAPAATVPTATRIR